MYHKTLSYYSTIFYRSFSAFTGEQLQAVGLNFWAAVLRYLRRQAPGLFTVRAY